MTQKVLILDGNARSALAATRSLGSRGLHVVVGGDSNRTLAGSSQYCRESFSYPAPGEHPDGFVSTLKSECARREISVIFPMTELSTLTVLKHREQLGGLQLPFVDFSTFDALSDKWKLLQSAARLNVSIPET